MSVENNMNPNEIWQAILGEMEVLLSKPNFNTWFKNTSLLSVDKNQAVIAVPNEFTASWFRKKYHTKIFEAIKKHCPILKIDYKIISPQVNEQLKTAFEIKLIEPPEKHPDKTPTSHNGLRADFTFDSFVVGGQNRLAYATALAVAQSPGVVHNPLFLYGGVGLGKTHLLHAIGNQIFKNEQKAKIFYISCEDFCNEFIYSIQTNTTESFKKKYRNVDVFLVDDIQFLSRKEGTQQEFFHTFNALHQKNHQIVMTSDRLPREIPHLESRLSSRFGGGMVADIQMPETETRQAILKAKSQARGWDVPNPILEFIAQNIKSNVRELEGALNRLVTQAMITNQEITPEFATNTLEGIIASNSHKNFDPSEIIAKTAQYFNLAVNDILGKSRERKLVRPRQIAMYIMRDELNMPFPKIGDVLGGKDHTTIMHGVKLITNLIKKDEQIQNHITLIKENLYSAN